jgi:CDP-paratose 2-epimerase
MVGAAAYWVKERGWKTVLGGPSPFDAYWLNLMGERGLLELMDAVGIHGFPGTWDSDAGSWTGWDHQMSETRKVLERWNPGAEIWITETGYSTWRHDELEQANRFLEALDVGADRLYWYGWRDLPRDVAIQEGYWFDARHYHLGAVDSANNPKLLARLLSEGGIDRLREVTRLAAPAIGKTSRPVVITGGSGFIGSNLAESFLAEGREVAVLDNLSRPGVEQNLEWLRERHGDRVHPLAVDLRDAQTTRDALTEAESVFHLAAQTAVTTSLTNPMDDFQVNAAGTLHVLEGVRAAMEAQGRKIPLVFASTNKVYGALEDISMEEGEDRYLPADPEIRAKGIGEWRPLDFCTPYGCSKGVADQYVLDYAKSYGVPAAVLRMSCVYGPRQFGTEDQGWVAHFLIRALENKPISIYGDGKQVRDVLHVDDAVVAYRTVLSNISALSGAVFNLGGGPENAVSLRLVLGEMERLVNRPLDVSYNPWRQGDQPYFVADCSKLTDRTGWRARIGWEEGLQDLASWLRRNRDLPAAAQPERSQRAYA